MPIPPPPPPSTIASLTGTDGVHVFPGNDGGGGLTTTFASTTMTIIGDPVAHTLFFTAIGAANIIFVGNTGTAASNSLTNLLNIKGLGPISSTASGNDIFFGLTAPVPIVYGGTNATEFAFTNGLIYFDGNQLSSITQGTAGQILFSQGTNAPPIFSSGGVTTIDISANVGSATSSSFTIIGTGPLFTTMTGTGVNALLTISLTAPVPIVYGGTNASSFDYVDGLIYFDGTKLNSITASTANLVLISTGTVPVFSTLSTLSSITITASEGGSVSGNAFNLLGSGPILTTASGSTLTISLTGVIPIVHGGTNASSFDYVDGLIYFDGTKLNSITASTANLVLISTGTVPVFSTLSTLSSITITASEGGSVSGSEFNLLGSGPILTTASGSTLTISLTGVIPIVHGGTNASSFDYVDGLIYFDGTKLNSITASTANLVLISTGTVPVFSTLSTLSSITITASEGGSVSGSEFNLLGSGPILTTASGSTLTISLTGVIPIVHGGTNASSFDYVDGLIYFDGTKLNSITASTANLVLISTGTVPVFSTLSTLSSITITASEGGSVSGSEFNLLGSGPILTTASGSTLTISLTGVIPIVHGGTNASSFDYVDGLIYFDGTKLNSITASTANLVLISTGTVPVFSTLSTLSSITITASEGGSVSGSEFNLLGSGPILTTAFGKTLTISLTGVIPIVNGGTNASSFAFTNGLIYFDGTKLNSITASTANLVLISTGTVPVFSTLSTLSSITITASEGGSVSGSEFNLLGSGPILTTAFGKTLTISLTGVIPIVNGGTNASSFAFTNGLIYFDGTKFSSITLGTMGQSLLSQGTAAPPVFSSSTLFHYTNVTSNSYTVISSDYYLSVDSSLTAVSVSFPDTTTQYRTFIIKDRTGFSALNPITVTTVGGIVTIDAETSINLINPFGSLQLLYNGSAYEIF